METREAETDEKASGPEGALDLSLAPATYMTSPVISFALQSLSVFALCFSRPADYMGVT